MYYFYAVINIFVDFIFTQYYLFFGQSITIQLFLIAYEYQVSLLYLIAKQSHRVITSGTWELVPDSKNSNRGCSSKMTDRSSFSAHCVVRKNQVLLLCQYAEQSICTKNFRDIEQ